MDHTIIDAPLIEFLRPYIDVILQGLVAAFIVFFAGVVKKYTGVQLSQAALDKIRAAASTQAGILVAGAADNLVKTQITVDHPAVASAANFIFEHLPDAAKAAGLTPDTLKAIIVGEIGKLQASATAAK